MGKTNTTSAFLAVVIAAVCSGCLGCLTKYGWEIPVRVSNRADYSVHVQQTCEDSLQWRPALTMNPMPSFQAPDGTEIKRGPAYRILPDSTGYFRGYASKATGIPRLFGAKDGVDCGDDELKLFVVREETIRSRSWKEIYELQLYEEKLVRSSKELRQSVWARDV